MPNIFLKDASQIKKSNEISFGILNQNQFNFSVLTPSNSSNNPLPFQILIRGQCFGQNLNIVITQKSGNSSFIKSQVWIRSEKNISRPDSAKIV